MTGGKDKKIRRLKDEKSYLMEIAVAALANVFRDDDKNAGHELAAGEQYKQKARAQIDAALSKKLGGTE